LMAAFLATVFITPLNLWNAPSLQIRDFIPYSFLFAFLTAGLIVFFDATSKYLGGIGLVTLGAIRALHCLIGQPQTPVLFVSMILLTHVIVVSTVAYRLENKRPRLRRGDWLAVILGLVMGNGLALAYMAWRGSLTGPNFWSLIGPGIAGTLFVVWAVGLMLS